MTDTAPADVLPRGSMVSGPVESRGRSLPSVGRNELGTIVVRDDVVAKIAACAAVEIPDAGAAATRVMGRAVPGGGRLGLRATDLEALPKTKAEIDGNSAFLSVELSIRWPASVPDTTAQVRQHVRERVQELAGLTVAELDITVADLATTIAPPPRVR
jgi:uncharacterized alkaline shock family protein YloU